MLNSVFFTKPVMEAFAVEANPVISSQLPDLVNAYISHRTQRLAKEKEVELIKEAEEELKKTIITKFKEQGLKALGADNGIVKMSSTDEPKAENWDEIWNYIKETGEFDLLHKRLTNTAVKARWEDGVLIPGVGKETVYRLTVSGVANG